MTTAVVDMKQYRETKETIAAAVRMAVLEPERWERFSAAMQLAGSVMKNHGWKRLRFPTFILERGPFGWAALRARERSKERGVCPYCGSPFRTWVAGEGIVHFGCMSCGGVYKERVVEHDQIA